MGFIDLFKKRRGDDRPATPKPAAGDVPIADALVGMSVEISRQIALRLPTEQDTWWFLAEQYDRLVDSGEAIEQILAMSSLRMHPIEYEGRRSENSYVGKPNTAAQYVQGARRVLAEKFDGDIADMVVAQAFVMFAEQNMPALDAVRIKYAAHYHGNCIRDNAPRNAQRWQDVIDEVRSK